MNIFILTESCYEVLRFGQAGLETPGCVPLVCVFATVQRPSSVAVGAFWSAHYVGWFWLVVRGRCSGLAWVGCGGGRVRLSAVSVRLRG